MKRTWLGMLVALIATFIMLVQNGAFAEKPKEAAKVAPAKAEAARPAEPAAPAGKVTIQADKTSLDNGGTIIVTGTAPAGMPVYIEIWSDSKVKASRFDADVDKDTGKRPYQLYLTSDIPAYYKMFVPKEQKDKIDAAKKEGGKWSFSKVLKETGADAVYSVPAKIKIDRYQATLMGSIVGSRGDLLEPMDAKENKKRSMQLIKARFRSVDKVMAASVQMNPDGTFKADIPIREGLAPGSYKIVAAVDKDIKSDPVSFENNISFPLIYLSNAGTSLNLFWPFLLTLAIAIFGVLMGAGGGFILNPLLVSIWPLPHTIVAGTVMPTVLFSQASGIYNYSKIKFINWKLGTTIGIAMLVGGFIGPKLTEMITLDQFKFVFGWILLVLGGLMFWQTTPGYLEKNKKEQAILKEYQKRAKEASGGANVAAAK
ncbi:MAG TPA: sulfite exporter TauE/SafE family protein [Nitrospirota bacterium]|nr:sulfite exporter TauE/SafE family protein [Nitrospirota bacterium]